MHAFQEFYPGTALLQPLINANQGLLITSNATKVSCVETKLSV